MESPTPDEYLLALRTATDVLVRSITGLRDADARQPSLLPGWTRGHVLTHLARNAEGGTRLLQWARTGVPSYEYQSVAARAADIERGSGRPAASLIEDVRDSAEGFFAAAAGMSALAWRQTIRWTTGDESEAAVIVPSRLGEVLIHHVDLAIGYRPADWPAAFVRDYLDRAVTALSKRHQAFRMEATDTGRIHQVGAVTAASAVLVGPEPALLAWLLGRSDGSELARAGNGQLPAPPSLYAV